MNINLLIIGMLLLSFGYLVGVKGQIRLITFLKHKQVRNQHKVAILMGGSQVILGAVCITFGALGLVQEEPLIVLVLISMLVISAYVKKYYVV